MHKIQFCSLFKIAQNSLEKTVQKPSLDKSAGRIASTLLPPPPPEQVLSCEFYEVFNTNFFIEHLQSAAFGNVIIFHVFSGNFYFFTWLFLSEKII